MLNPIIVIIFAIEKNSNDYMPNEAKRNYFLLYLKDMLQLIFSPTKGWEDVSADGYDSNALLRKGLVPFIIIASLTVLLKWFYHTDASIVVLLQQAIVCFLKYFATFYLAVFVFTLYLPTCISGELSMNRCNTFLLYGVGLLALVNLIENCMPVELALVFIMPVYVLFILWRGLRYMEISFSGVGTFLLMIIFSIIAPPYVLQYLFNLVIPEY